MEIWLVNSKQKMENVGENSETFRVYLGKRRGKNGNFPRDSSNRKEVVFE